ncbi:ABC transporter permease [Paenibacillus sp. J2TS4]|uniref:ABC transporter permease n=1 Tax=Paenibacillus sp. J2TS4 TaxID=2807194 RepID=UPI001B0139F2|nr:ABC transporter permease [Paenibacillus sp. J2TS4]GIP33824.1 hypothetical protein J2TS4_30340 [Paenibacillus sp. J2TS4]
MIIIQLVKNENMKLYQRKPVWGMLAAGGILSALMVIMENIIENRAVSSFWEIVAKTTLIGYQVTLIFVIIIAAQLFANEYQWGTIRLLLLQPVSRSKIWLSKFIAALLYAWLGMAAAFVAGLMVAFCMPGFQGMTAGETVLNVFLPLGCKLLSFPLYIAVAIWLFVLSKSTIISLFLSLIFIYVTNLFLPFIAGLHPSASLLMGTGMTVWVMAAGCSQFTKQEIL